MEKENANTKDLYLAITKNIKLPIFKWPTQEESMRWAL